MQGLLEIAIQSICAGSQMYIVLILWSVDQHHQHYLGTCQKYKFLGWTLEFSASKIWRTGTRNLCFLPHQQVIPMLQV